MVGIFLAACARWARRVAKSGELKGGCAGGSPRYSLVVQDKVPQNKCCEGVEGSPSGGV